MPNGDDFQLYLQYRSLGGKYNYNEWKAQERPGVPVRDGGLRFPWETVAGEGFIAPWTRQVAVPTQEGVRYRQPLTLEQRRPPPTPISPEEEAAGVELGGLGVEVPPFPTEPPPEGFRWAFDRDLNRWVPQYAGLTAQQRARQEEEQRQRIIQEQQLVQQQARWEEEMEFQRRQAELARQPTPISPYQQQQVGLQRQQFGLQEQQFLAGQQQFGQQFGLQEQQFAAQQQQFQEQLAFQQAQAQATQEEQERQYMSQLAAQPINWLQYAAYTGQPPVIQPWMQPLGFQETEGALPAGVEVGQPIPGFQGQAGQQGMQTFANLPQLRTPSAQLQARWGPTAQAQFLGYRQARTGAAPEETQFRLGAGRAPTGAFAGFSRFR